MRKGFAGIWILGVVLVLALGFLGWWTIKNKQEVTTASVPQQQQLTLALTSPTEGELAIDNEILVRGKTTPGATVAMFTEGDEVIVEAGTSGDFEGTVTLASGINTLVVTAFGEDGQEKSVNLNIVYDAEG